MKSQNLRLITELGIFAIVALGLVFNIGIGDTCVFGWDQIAAVCPLGILGTYLAGKAVAPMSLICLAITLAVTILLGRAACGWLCPVPLMRRIFGGKKSLAKHYSDVKDAELSTAQPAEASADAQAVVLDADAALKTAGTCKPSSCAACAEAGSCAEMHAQAQTKTGIRTKTNKFDTRFAVLIAALASTAILGFPVFCLICPVGLSIATFIGVWQLITMNQGTWMLVLMPAILIVELVVMRKWCHRFCPIGALFSLISNANRTFRPTIDAEKCLRETGKAVCNACHNACPEGIDLHDENPLVGRNECIKCRECIDACPTKAITMPFLPKKKVETIGAKTS